MELNAQYALHDSDTTPPVWAARIRLTPELLDKLCQVPEQVQLQLSMTNGPVQCCSSTKKMSLMTLKLVETEEQYELLSFPEDPRINHVCNFRRPVGKNDGYSIYKTGAIYQKLLVQRLLDDTEKDRIKDKHAQSVLASKSRRSQLIDSKLEKNAKRQRVVTRLSKARTLTTAGSNSVNIATGHKKSKKLVLPSALTKDEATNVIENIEKGFAVKMEVPVIAYKDKKLADDMEEQENAEENIFGTGKEAAAAVSCDAECPTLFSSDSDDEHVAVSQSRVLQKQKKGASTHANNKASAVKAKENDMSDDNFFSHDMDKETIEIVLDATRVPKKPSSAVSKVIATVGGSIEPVKMDGHVTQDKQGADRMGMYALKSVRPSAGRVEVKRPRVRSSLVFDRVKQSRLPDLSFFPSAVAEICQRVAHYCGRSVILDESDYYSFVETHENFRQDWEMLDKAYSIEMIKTEGLHLQLEMDMTETNHDALKARIQASVSKKEGLLCVRDAMASIQKILLRIQASIDCFDLKPNRNNDS